jgi:hypothetical protein
VRFSQMQMEGWRQRACERVCGSVCNSERITGARANDELTGLGIPVKRR